MLERNDIDGAVALYRRKLLAGDWTPEDAQMVLMLQDDPEALMDRFEQLADADPEVSAALARMG